MSSIALVAGAAGGVEAIGPELVKPLVERGHVVGVTLTPSAATWLEASGLIEELERLTGLPVRSAPRLPSEASPHPKPDVYVGAPLSASSVAKLALGIADNQALTSLCENVATTPMVVFPRVNAAHSRQPAWSAHIAALRSVGVRLVYGEDVWPLAEPRVAAPNRALPWAAIIEATEAAL
ncbi:flavoprotein [Terrabacter sp. GCM10028922]|uniref:flavoprotein n=1 Tax=Terrabacter sp. GCM10028922 TaxID=3273428 RepID=UPI00361DC101